MKSLTYKIIYIAFFLLLTNTIYAQQDDFDKQIIENAMIKALEWQEQHPIYAISPADWTNGAYYIGVTKAHQATNNQIFLAALKTMGYKNQWKPAHRIYHADDIAIGYPYLYINTTRKNLVDLEPTKVFIDKHLYESNPWKEGTDKQDFKHILWWWCDALFMAPPVIAYYAEQTGKDEYLDAMHKYYAETYELLFDKEEKLFFRDKRFLWNDVKEPRKEKNGKKIFWSRGNGWVIGGLALLLEHLPKDYEHRSFYETLYKDMAHKIKDIQPKEGLWTTSLLDPTAYSHGEVSGSGFYTFALAWGINNGYLDKKAFTPVVKKAWSALLDCQLENGMVGWVQNIGYKPDPASATSWQNYGTGSFLLAGSEVLKLR